MKDEYIYDAGRGDRWARTYVVEKTLQPSAQETSDSQPPAKHDYHLVPEERTSPIGGFFKVMAATAAVVGIGVGLTYASKRRTD